MGRQHTACHRRRIQLLHCLGVGHDGLEGVVSLIDACSSREGVGEARRRRAVKRGVLAMKGGKLGGRDRSGECAEQGVYLSGVTIFREQ